MANLLMNTNHGAERLHTVSRFPHGKARIWRDCFGRYRATFFDLNGQALAGVLVARTGELVDEATTLAGEDGKALIGQLLAFLSLSGIKWRYCTAWHSLE